MKVNQSYDLNHGQILKNLSIHLNARTFLKGLVEND